MNDLSIDAFREAIHATHNADSKLIERVPVHEQFQGETVWEGEVLVFELIDHPEASCCYAWEVDGEVIAVLGVGPVQSAQDAVRASILADNDGSN